MNDQVNTQSDAVGAMEATRFVLKDAGGRARAALGCGHDGTPGLSLFDGQGNLRLEIALVGGSGEPAAYLVSGGEVKAIVGLSAGSPFLTMKGVGTAFEVQFGEDGVSTLSLGGDGVGSVSIDVDRNGSTAGLTINDPHDRPRVDLWYDEEGGASMMLKGPEGGASTELREGLLELRTGGKVFTLLRGDGGNPRAAAGGTGSSAEQRYGSTLPESATAVKEVCARLAKAGVVQVKVEYDGLRGKGVLTAIDAFDGAGEKVEPFTNADYPVIQGFVFDLLGTGWADDEGAAGGVAIDLARGKVLLTVAERYIEMNEIKKEFDL